MPVPSLNASATDAPAPGTPGFAARHARRCSSDRKKFSVVQSDVATRRWSRLCEPSSELRTAEDWYRRTALEDLFALPAPLVNDDRCYRAPDRLLPHKTALDSTW